ncbi:hypothetical protein M3Y96_01031600 [Aphelenchoides besseyi]|nr:hypothetical protein M3Y96_01031600 [Aphelenchoides besseyi]
MKHYKPLQKVLIGVAVFFFVTVFVRSNFYSPTITDSSQPQVQSAIKPRLSLKAENDQQQQVEIETKDEPRIPSFVNFRQHYKLFPYPKAKLCVIGGNEPALFSEIWCFLADPNAYKQTNRTIFDKPYDERLCKEKKELEQEGTSKSHELQTSWLEFAVVRNPMERFVATFISQCFLKKDEKEVKERCFDCGKDVNCFLEKLQDRLVAVAKKPSDKTTTIDEEAFYPQNWNCDFESHLQNYTLLRLEVADEGKMKLLNALYFPLRERNVNNDDINRIYKQIQERPSSADKDDLTAMAMMEKKRLLPTSTTITSHRIDFFHLFSFLRPWRIFTLIALMALIYVLLTSSKPKHYMEVVNTLTNGTLLSTASSRVDEHMRWVVDSDWIVAPLRKFERRFRLNFEKKINVCAIEKNMSTILTAIMCFLFNPQKFKAEGRNVNTETFHERMCGFENELFEFIGDLKNYTVKREEWLHMAVSRDPIERFISGFVDKCVVEKIYTQDRRNGTCQNCKTNVTCFIERMHDRMLRYGRGEKLRIKFDEQHFFPQNWRCNFRSHLNDYKVVRFENSKDFFDEVFTLFAEHGVSEEHLSFVRNQINNGKTVHTTTGREERDRVVREVRESRYLMTKLVQMYYYDFVLMGYNIPEIPTE